MDPIATQIGGLTITWYGLMMGCAFVAGLWTASRRSLQAGIRSETILDLGPWLIIGGLAGARLLYVISYWREQFAGEPLSAALSVWRGGLVFYGGLIGASLGCLLFARLKHLPVWPLADVLAPSIALGSVFGRVGCLLNGCCYGTPCSLPWAIHFPQGHKTYPSGVHPTELYDAAANLALYGVLTWLGRRKKFDGQVFALYLLGYAVLRSVVELFRGDYPRYYFGGFVTPAQMVSVILLASSILLLRFLPRPTQVVRQP